MLRNYLKTIIRQTRKNTSFSFINILGLSIGMAACLVIAKYGLFHGNFDNYHSKKEQIFRLHTTFNKNGKEIGQNNKSFGLTGPTLVETDPHVLESARLYGINYQNNTMTYKGEKSIVAFEQKGIYLVDPGLFDILDFEVAAGDLSSFDQPNKVIISQATATKYFGETEAGLGEKVTIAGNSGSQDFEVIAILKDQPENSHLQYDVLGSMATADEYTNNLDSWTASSFYTYLLLDKPESKPKVEGTINTLFTKQVASAIQEYGYTITDFELKNIEELHTADIGSNDFINPVNKKLLYALGAIAVIILFIAWINYLNLSLVKTYDRLKEIGIRKVLGSKMQQITALFTLEALTLNILAFLIAITFVQLGSPFTRNLTGMDFSLVEDYKLTLAMFGIVLLGSALVGTYPSIMIRTMDSSRIFSGQKQLQKKGKANFRSSLVVLQFIITFLLVAATLTVYYQVNYMKNADLGFSKDNILVLQSPPGDVSSNDREDLQKYNTLKTELLRNSSIEELAIGGEIPGEPITWGTNIWPATKNENSSVDSRLISMGLGFTDFFGIDLIAGRKLREGDSPWEKGDVVINAEMSRQLGFDTPEEAVGAKLSGFYAPLVVRGVVENHHHNSLEYKYDPIAYILSSWTEYYFIKVEEGTDMNTMVASIENEWNQIFTDAPFNYFFLDTFYNRQYADEEQFGNIFTTFSVLAIVIACLGLFGLTSFTLRQRTKEVGIRKVLGADTNSLILLLSKNYLLMIVIAYVVAMPLAWIGADWWLENYEFRIDPGTWLLLTPLVIVLVIAGVTIVGRLMNTAKKNPVDSLRYE